MTSVSSSVNPSGIVVPAGGLQQGNVAMTTINSQVVSGKHAFKHTNIKQPRHVRIQYSFFDLCGLLMLISHLKVVSVTFSPAEDLKSQNETLGFQERTLSFYLVSFRLLQSTLFMS